jgi:peptide deformylase
MAILKIARMGHPVLRRRAAPVADPTDPRISALIADMIETMVDAPGVGLAAPQVHASVRIVVFRVPESRADDPDAPAGSPSGAVPLTVMINPEIETLDAAAILDWESCLSVPGLTGLVPRARHIRYRWQTPDGETRSREATGFHARVVQHECDHLDGVLYPMRLPDLTRFGFVEEVARAGERATNRPAEAEAAD